MAYSGSDCGKHPKPKQLPGVCSWCLRERLSKLTDYDNQINTKFSSKVSHSSSLSSSPRSLPAHSSTSSAKNRHRHRRNRSEAFDIPVGLQTGSISSNSSTSNAAANVLKKSHSASCAPRILSKGKLNDGELMEGNCKKKTGFWKKLIHSTSKKAIGGLMHSKTVRV
ncbi:hypothetical protein Ancab_003485 [Ancistrocladus abbreviatus]